MRKNTPGTDTLSSVADFFGLGDFLDNLISGFNKTGDELALELLTEIKKKEGELNNIDNDKLNKLNMKLSELASIYNKGAFKSIIGDIQNRVTQNINKTQNLQNNIENRIAQQQNIAQEAIGKRRFWAKENEGNLKKDINDLHSANKTDLNKIENLVI